MIIDIPSDNVVYDPNRPDLLPCPFCNSKPIFRVVEKRGDEDGEYEHPLYRYKVYCEVCGASTIWSTDRDIPIRRWNMRSGIGETK